MEAASTFVVSTGNDIDARSMINTNTSVSVYLFFSSTYSKTVSFSEKNIFVFFK